MKLKHSKKAGAALLLAVLTVSQTAGLASAKVSTVSAEELFHSKQFIKDPGKRNKLNASQVEKIRANSVRARLHWDAVEQKEALSSLTEEQAAPKANPIIITAADMEKEKKQTKKQEAVKEQETRKEFQPVQPQQPVQQPELQPKPQPKPQPENAASAGKEAITAMPAVKRQEEFVELPPIQPILQAQAAKETAPAKENAAKPRIVAELPPIEQIAAPVTAAAAKDSEQEVELTVQPVL